MIRATIVLFALALAASPNPAGAHARTATPTQPGIKERVRHLLDDYSRKDVDRIMRVLDDRNVLMIGTDVSEVAGSRQTIETLLRNDFKLWDTSQFGQFKDFYVQSSDTMATAFFDVPWQATTGGQTRSFTIRLVTTWRKAGNDWKLTQILNTVPTTGQSAAEILNAPKP